MSSKHYVYILQCADKSLYCGYTNDPEKRLATHNRGKGAKYTRARLPVTLVYSQSFETKSQALKEEIRIKKLKRTQKEALIEINQQRYI